MLPLSLVAELNMAGSSFTASPIADQSELSIPGFWPITGRGFAGRLQTLYIWDCCQLRPCVRVLVCSISRRTVSWLPELPTRVSDPTFLTNRRRDTGASFISERCYIRVRAMVPANICVQKQTKNLSHHVMIICTIFCKKGNCQFFPRLSQ